MTKTQNQKCERCRRYMPDVDAESLLDGRCQAVLQGSLHRHAELGSASILETAVQMEKWTLNQVQGDGGGRQ